MFDAQLIRLGVIGNPIKHSQSPEIHYYFAAQAGLYVDYRRIYAALDQFETQVDSFFKNGGVGLNVTLPFKERAASIATRLSKRAELVKVVNTLQKTDAGIFGDTTDGQGFINDVIRLASPDVLTGDIVIVGAGGAVRGLLPDLLQANPKSLTILNRTEFKAAKLVRELETWRSDLGFTTSLIAGDLSKLTAVKSVDFLIQGASFWSVQHQLNLSKTFCYDLNYGDRSAEFCAWARLSGAQQVHTGLGMLIAQAAASFKLWTGQAPDIGDAMEHFKTSNIWSEAWWQPPFHKVDFLHLRDAVTQRFEEKERLFQQRLIDIKNSAIALTWDSLVRFYEEYDDKLDCVWRVLVHLNNAISNHESRDAFNALQAEISEHYAREQQNSLFKELVERLVASDQFQIFSSAQKKWCENLIRDFQLAGVDLPADKQNLLVTLERELADLGARFADQVLDATEAWFLDVPESDLDGVPCQTLQLAKETYRHANPELNDHLCRLTLKDSMYLSVMRSCQNEEVRRIVYEVYVTRSSELGPQASLYDNSLIMSEILQKRQQQAELLGFENYAAYSLSTKMAKSPEQVVKFLSELAQLCTPQARRELQELEQFAVSELGLARLEPWDFTFASEQLKARRFSLNTELIQEYFPVPHVLQGLFKVVEKLFGVTSRVDLAVPAYQEDVRFVELSRHGKIIGGLYIDLYARDKKRDGAWMDECRSRFRLADGSIQRPLAYLVCNASQTSDAIPGLMTHDEVVTLFHEMGHCLHHVLTEVEVLGVSGIRGIEWDAVEVLSQLLENWCYSKEVLPLLSSHYKTGLPLPAAELEKIVAAKNFQSALTMMRQVEYSLLDMYLHMHGKQVNLDSSSIENIVRRVRREVGILPVPDWHRFANTFTHIFSDGYAAGYYGYLWAQAYAADLFDEFRRAGVFNLTLSAALYSEWFAIGGIRTATENFLEFMGRDVKLQSLLDELEIQQDKDE